MSVWRLKFRQMIKLLSILQNSNMVRFPRLVKESRDTWGKESSSQREMSTNSYECITSHSDSSCDSFHNAGAGCPVVEHSCPQVLGQGPGLKHWIKLLEPVPGNEAYLWRAVILRLW